MTALTRTLAAIAIGAALSTGALAQSARDVLGPTPFLPIENEPPPRLIVDPPLPGPLARGVVIIQYRTENFRILPVLGPAAVNLSPRAGHLHVSLNDLPWRWADAGNTNTIVVNGLPPGEHSVLIELADPVHRVLAGQRVAFTVPQSGHHAH